MMKVLSWWFHQCLTFASTFPLQECSKTGTVGHSSNRIYRSHKLKTYLSYEASFLFQNVKNFCGDSENIKKNWKNIFRF